MAEYTHLICPVCNEQFLEDSDVVVCPTCGTPHHRECYKALGRCANTAWHEENKIYDPELERAALEGERARQQRAEEALENKPLERIVCRRCGRENEHSASFCSNCGMPFVSGYGTVSAQNGVSPDQNRQTPFITINTAPFTPPDPNEEFDGVKGWKLAAVVRDNQFSFMPRFRNFAQTKKKVSFNFFAFFLAPYYFFYRKMYGLGIIGLIISLICEIPSTIFMFTNEYLSYAMDATVTSGLNLTTPQLQMLYLLVLVAGSVLWGMKILSGLFANYLYYNKCKKMCNDIDGKVETREEFFEVSYKKGGVNKIIVIVFIVIGFLSTWFMTFLMSSGIINF